MLLPTLTEILIENVNFFKVYSLVLLRSSHLVVMKFDVGKRHKRDSIVGLNKLLKVYAILSLWKQFENAWKFSLYAHKHMHNINYLKLVYQWQIYEFRLRWTAAAGTYYNFQNLNKNFTCHITTHPKISSFYLYHSNVHCIEV